MVDESFIPADAPPGAESPALPSPGSQDIQETSSNKITSEQLHQELAELKRSFAEFARQNLPEIDQVRQELAAATAERDSAAGELRQIKRQTQLADLAAKYGFSDVEYLDFVLHKHNIAPDDAEKTTAFMQKFRQSNPHNFILPLQPGSGSRPGALPDKRKYSQAGTSRMDEVELMLSGAPEIC